MLNRREFLARTLQGTSLLAVGSVVPGFLASTARAAEAGKESVLVVVELTGGNDGLNTVIPYADDLYHKARPTLKFKEDQVLKIDDHVGLHPALRGLAPNQPNAAPLAVVQGVGYPNPDRSHFESMDIWQSADPKRQTATGWLGRGIPGLQDKHGGIPAVQVGPNRLPLALQGAAGGVVSVNNKMSYRLELHGDEAQQKARRQLIEDLAKAPKPTESEDLLQFVQRRQVQTFTTLEKLQEVLRREGRAPRFGETNTLLPKLDLVARLVEQDFGTRVFYVALDGFDTHSGQAEMHRKLLQDLGDSVANFFTTLKQSGHDKRVVVMTFSEFGRRVHENGSRGTDHGSGSCLFVCGPAVKAGAVGQHPSLKEGDLDSGDLKWHTDFRRVYATLLDCWLNVKSETVLGAKFEHLDFLAKA